MDDDGLCDRFLSISCDSKRDAPSDADDSRFVHVRESWPTDLVMRVLKDHRADPEPVIYNLATEAAEYLKALMDAVEQQEDEEFAQCEAKLIEGALTSGDLPTHLMGQSKKLDHYVKFAAVLHLTRHYLTALVRGQLSQTAAPTTGISKDTLAAACGFVQQVQTYFISIVCDHDKF